MMHRDLPYHEGIRAKARHKYKLHKKISTTKIMQALYIALENGPFSGHSKHCLIRHSFVSSMTYSLRDSSEYL